MLDWDRSSTSSRDAQKIAAFLGTEATHVHLTQEVLRDGAPVEKLVPRCICLIVDVETLAKAVDAMQTGVGGLRSLICSSEHLFIYGFRPTDRHAAILRVLSSDRLRGVRPVPDANVRFHVAEGARKWCGQFSGLSLGTADATRENVFVEGDEEVRQKVMIRLGDAPFFVRIEYGE